MKTLGKIGLFFVITFVFTILLAVVQQFLSIDTAQISLPQFGPGIAALVMLRLYRKEQVNLTVTLKGVHPRKYLVALGIPLVVPLILFLIYNQFVASVSLPAVDGATFVAMLGGILLGAFGEEVGWRGYAQNLLDHRLNGVASFLIVGVLWGVWHIGNFQHGLLYMLFFVFSTIGYSAVIAWLLHGANYNVVLATMFHFGVNVGFYILQNAMTDIRLVALNGVVWLGTAVIIVARNSKAFLPAETQPQKRQFIPSQPRSSSVMPGN